MAEVSVAVVLQIMRGGLKVGGCSPTVPAMAPTVAVAAPTVVLPLRGGGGGAKAAASAVRQHATLPLKKGIAAIVKQTKLGAAYTRGVR